MQLDALRAGQRVPNPDHRVCLPLPQPVPFELRAPIEHHHLVCAAARC
jgi:hypothetical protein